MVYRTIIEYGTEIEWDYLWNKFKSSSFEDGRWEFLEALGYTTQVELLKVLKFEKFQFYLGNNYCAMGLNFQRYFGLILSAAIPLEYKSTAIFSTLKQKQNLHLVLDFVFVNYKAIAEM